MKIEVCKVGKCSICRKTRKLCDYGVGVARVCKKCLASLWDCNEDLI